MKSWSSCLAAICAIVAMVSCSSSSTSSGGSSSEDTDISEVSGALVGAMFSSSADANQSAPVAITKKLLNSIVKKAIAQGSPPDTCDSLSDDPGSVSSESIDPDFTETDQETKTYGPDLSTEQVTLDESDFCTDTDGQSNTAAEGQTLFAYFTLTGTAEAECTDGSTGQMLSGSEGVWRQDADTDKCPEIFGTFRLSGDGGTTIQVAACHIILSCEGSDEGSSEGTVTSAYCENESGESMSLDTDTTCTINAE